MTEILSEEELVLEGKSILREYGTELNPALVEVLGSHTHQDVELVWDDYYADSDEEISHLAVRESVDALRERYDLRKLTWLRDWYIRYSELEAIFGKRPKGIDYTMFFAIRGPDDIVNHKNTTLYSCLNYLWELESSKEKRRVARERTVARAKGEKVSVDFSTLGIRRRTKEWMQEHPEEVEAVKRKYREGA